MRSSSGNDRSETAGGKHAVDMGMMLQSLVPGIEHAEEADLRAEVTRIAGNLQQSGSTHVKQQVVEQPFILQCECSQVPWQGRLVGVRSSKLGPQISAGMS